MVSGNTLKIKLESAQYDKGTKIPRGERKMESKNIYLSVFPEFLELLSFCLLKLTKNIDLKGNESNDNVEDNKVIVIERLE